MDTAESFGQWLRKRRRGMDLTQSELANRAGCAQVTIKKLEADQLRPSKQLAEVVLRHLGVPLEAKDAYIEFARGSPEPNLPSLKLPKNNLPVELTSFIGREKEMVDVKQAISEHRLVTLTGSGGTGKTRLSVKVAADLLEIFPNGVWFVELAPLTDGDLISQAIISVLNLHVTTGSPALQILCDYLREKKTLLILDNCEHLLGGCAKLAEALLSGAPGLRILATSREALGVSGEVVWVVPSLSLPDVKNMPNLEQLLHYEAVQLFDDRAKLVQPHFQVTKGNAPAITQICSHLDGIPLAIELAAARIKMMTAEQINDHLDDRFHLLTSGGRTGLPRQQTLRATMDWGYDLLSEQEKALLRRLAVFSSGWTLDAAEQVCADDKIARSDVLDILAHLVDKSLVIVDEQTSETRYSMLETVRHYAREKLFDGGEEESLRARHLEYYLELTEETEPKLKTSEQLIVLRELETQLDNFRLVLTWSFNNSGSRFAREGLRVACALDRIWNRDTRLSVQGLNWYEKGLTILRERNLDKDLLYAKVLCLAGNLKGILGEPASGRLMLEEGISLYRRVNPVDKRDLADALNRLVWVDWQENCDLPAECLAADESVKICRALGFSGLWDLAQALLCRGWVAYWQKDPEAARTYGEESRTYFERLGDNLMKAAAIELLGAIAIGLCEYELARSLVEECISLSQDTELESEIVRNVSTLADIDRMSANYSAASKGYKEALDYYRGTGDKAMIGVTLTNIGRVVLFEGNYKQAARLLREGLLILQEAHQYVWETVCLAALSEAIRAQGQLLCAARLLGTLSLHSEIWWSDVIQKAYKESLTATKEALDLESFAKAWDEGVAMNLDEAIEYALNVE